MLGCGELTPVPFKLSMKLVWYSHQWMGFVTQLRSAVMNNIRTPTGNCNSFFAILYYGSLWHYEESLPYWQTCL